MTNTPKPTTDMPLIDLVIESYAPLRKLSDNSVVLFRRSVEQLLAALGRQPLVSDLPQLPQLNLSEWSFNLLLILWRYCDDIGVIELDESYRRKTFSKKKKEWPAPAKTPPSSATQTPLADFIRENYLPAEPSDTSKKKMMLLLDHLSAAIGRTATVGDLNQMALAALTHHLRAKRKLTRATVAAARQYFRSVWRCGAELGLVADLPKTVRIGGRRAARKRVLTKELQKRIKTAAQMRAAGNDWQAVAKHFGLSDRAIMYWRRDYPDHWKAAFDAAMIAEVERVREIAGSTKVIDVGNLSSLLERCESWAATQGQTLFPAPTDSALVADPSLHTVPSFFESYVVPCCLTEAAAETIEMYRKAVKKFALTMGNPPLCKITNLTLASYRDILRRMAARGRGKEPLSVNTVITYLCHLQTVLDRAGPPTRRSRDAAGYIKDVPWVRIPREELGEAKIVADEDLAACYNAADLMRQPKDNPAQFWRAILVTARYLGLRARTLFSMEWKHIDLERRRVVLPATLLKGRKMLVLPLPEIVVQHLLTIRKDSGAVFVFPCREHFRQCLHKLQTAAGIDPAKHFGLHSLRRTAITKMWATSPAAAQLLAGHGSPIITRMHYVNVEDVLTDAMANNKSFLVNGKAGAA